MRNMLMTPAELSAYLKVPERTLQQWRYQRRGPRYTKAGQHVRYAAADVENWLRSNQSGGAFA